MISLYKDVGFLQEYKESKNGVHSGFIKHIHQMFLYESCRDIHHYKIMSPYFHEIVLFYVIKLNLKKSKVKVNPIAKETDCIAWVHQEDLKNIFQKEKPERKIRCFTPKNKNIGVNLDHKQLRGKYPNKKY
mmetsp:Transcript_6924/g.6084  ORF Transcript_6924/g.6084 Transcript_6924/m.6084 type:complete len:131 (+) Transcript_6924:535-927(+)